MYSVHYVCDVIDNIYLIQPYWIDHLKPLLHEDTETPVPVLRTVCAVLRALVLDDDVRVEFGKAHEHARIIAVDTLGLITDLLISKYRNRHIYTSNTFYYNSKNTYTSNTSLSFVLFITL